MAADQRAGKVQRRVQDPACLDAPVAARHGRSGLAIPDGDPAAEGLAEPGQSAAPAPRRKPVLGTDRAVRYRAHLDAGADRARPGEAGRSHPRPEHRSPRRRRALGPAGERGSLDARLSTLTVSVPSFFSRGEERYPRSTSAARARSAPTVACALGTCANGSNEKIRRALACVIFAASSAGTPSRYAPMASGATGHVESECG